MKSVALLHFAYPPNIGGVEILMREHATILADEGFKVSVFTGSGSSTNPKIIVKEIPELQSIQNFNPQLQEKIAAGNIDDDFYLLCAKITSILKNELQDIDTIIVHNMLTVSRNLAFIQAFSDYAKSTHKNIIVYVHDHMYVNINTVDFSKQKSDFEKKLITRRISGANYIVISETLQEQLSKIMEVEPENFHVIPNGINLKNFLEMDEKIWNIFERTSLFEKFPIILSPVNILRRKNILYSLKGVAELKKEYPNICYVISGQPSRHRNTEDYQSEVLALIYELELSKNVLFLSDFIERSLRASELHDLYNIADAVFYFSLAENFGLPLIEAPLVRTPIFVSDLKVFREVAGDCLEYIDTNSTTPGATAQLVKKAISTRLARLNYKARTEYNLKTIVTKKLIPLL